MTSSFKFNISFIFFFFLICVPITTYSSPAKENVLLTDYMKKQVLSTSEISMILDLLTDRQKTDNINTSVLIEQMQLEETRNTVQNYKLLRSRFNRKSKIDQLVLKALDHGELDNAENILKNTVSYKRLIGQNNKRNINYIFALGEISELKKEDKKTLRWLELLNTIAPENTVAWLVKAKKLTTLGEHQKAITAWKNLQIYARKADDIYSVAYGLNQEIQSIITLGGEDDLVIKKSEQLQIITKKNQEQSKKYRRKFSWEVE